MTMKNDFEFCRFLSTMDCINLSSIMVRPRSRATSSSSYISGRGRFGGSVSRGRRDIISIEGHYKSLLLSAFANRLLFSLPSKKKCEQAIIVALNEDFSVMGDFAKTVVDNRPF
jgi:hypothetical protein